MSKLRYLLIITACLLPLGLVQAHGDDQAAGEHAQETNEQHHDMDASSDDHDHAAVPGEAQANIIESEGLAYLVEPLIDVSKRMKIAISIAAEGEPLAVTSGFIIISPSGKVTAVTSQESSTVEIDVGQFEEGRWFITGAVGSRRVAFELAAYRQMTDLDSEVLAVFTPAPRSDGDNSEVFVYAFHDGENIHKLFTVKLLADHPAVAAGEEIQLIHTHFEERYNSEGFTPMANHGRVSFPVADSWDFEVTISGGLTETADFRVAAP